MAKSSLHLRNLMDIKSACYDTEGYTSRTSKDQIDVEQLILAKYEDLHTKLKVKPNLPELLRDLHEKYLLSNLVYLSTAYQSLDASRPWICYWIVHPLSLMGTVLVDSAKSKIARFLGKCQSPTGGFGGGPGQFPHLAATYAAVNALVILGTEEAYNIINRPKLLEFLKSIRQPDGSFAMHVDGEIDIRGVYCAMSVASLTGILNEDLVVGTAEWVASCQTYEGGFAGCPGMEAHGGYAFCGLSALVILGKGHLCDKESFLRWLVQRQMKVEGGFQGRTNKLVDGCYSFWQGAAFPMIYTLLAKDGLHTHDHLFDERALQEYLLICCQHPSGGLLDKPEKPRDIFHTCYTLSGLSVAQHFKNETRILGPTDNELEIIHPLYNIKIDYVKNAFLYYNKLGPPQQQNDGVQCVSI